MALPRHTQLRPCTIVKLLDGMVICIGRKNYYGGIRVAAGACKLYGRNTISRNEVAEVVHRPGKSLWKLKKALTIKDSTSDKGKLEPVGTAFHGYCVNVTGWQGKLQIRVIREYAVYFNRRRQIETVAYNLDEVAPVDEAAKLAVTEASLMGG